MKKSWLDWDIYIYIYIYLNYKLNSLFKFLLSQNNGEKYKQTKIKMRKINKPKKYKLIKIKMEKNKQQKKGNTWVSTEMWTSQMWS